MPVSYIQIPPDATGKKSRTYEKGAEGHSEYRARAEPRLTTGSYAARTGPFTIAAAADGATAGKFWLINPIGSGVIVALDALHYMGQLTVSTPAMASSPRLTFERVTFTGAGIGATVTPAKRKTSDAAPVGTVYTASTGMVLAGAAAFFALLPVVNLSTGTTSATPRAEMPAYFFGQPPFVTQVQLAAGEGIVCRQADAGTASDAGRTYIVNITWSEFTLP